MKKWTNLGLFIFLAIFIGCEKENHYSDSIIGKWQWTKSTAGEFGGAITAELYDTTHFVEFNNYGDYYFYDNSNRLIRTSRFELSADNISKYFRLLDTSHPEYLYRYTIIKDTLSIRCKDCCPYCQIDWIPFYKRLK